MTTDEGGGGMEAVGGDMRKGKIHSTVIARKYIRRLAYWGRRQRKRSRYRREGERSYPSHFAP